MYRTESEEIELLRSKARKGEKNYLKESEERRKKLVDLWIKMRKGERNELICGGK